MSIFNEWDPNFAGGYNPTDHTVESPKGKGVANRTPKQDRVGSYDTNMKNHGKAWPRKHNETAAMCDVDDDGIEHDPQGVHQSTHGDPVDGHTTPVGHDWPNQPSMQGGTIQPVEGNRYSDGGTLQNGHGPGGSVDEWSIDGLASIMEGSSINIPSLFNAYVDQTDFVALEDFQELVTAYGSGAILSEQSLLDMMRSSPKYMFYEKHDYNGRYWLVAPINEMGTSSCGVASGPNSGFMDEEEEEDEEDGWGEDEMPFESRRRRRQPLNEAKPRRSKKDKEEEESRLYKLSAYYVDLAKNKPVQALDEFIVYLDNQLENANDTGKEQLTDALETANSLRYHPMRKFIRKGDKYKRIWHPSANSPKDALNFFIINFFMAKMGERVWEPRKQEHFKGDFGTYGGYEDGDGGSWDESKRGLRRSINEQDYQYSDPEMDMPKNMMPGIDPGSDDWSDADYNVPGDPFSDPEYDEKFRENEKWDSMHGAGPYGGCPECGAEYSDEEFCPECGTEHYGGDYPFTDEDDWDSVNAGIEHGWDSDAQQDEDEDEYDYQFESSIASSVRAIVENDAMDSAEGNVIGGSAKATQSPDLTGEGNPGPDEMTDHGDPFGAKQTNTLDGPPIIKGTAKGLSEDSSKSVKENIARLATHVKSRLRDKIVGLKNIKPKYTILVQEGNSLNRTSPRSVLSTALADAEEILQIHNHHNVVFESKFYKNGKLVKKVSLPLVKVKKRTPLMSENKALFRFSRTAELFANNVVRRGASCEIMEHNWGTAVAINEKRYGKRRK